MPNVVPEINTPRREHVAAAVRYRHRLVLFTCIPRRVHVSATNVISIQSRFHFPAGRRRCQPTFRNKSPPSRVCAIHTVTKRSNQGRRRLTLTTCHNWPTIMANDIHRFDDVFVQYSPRRNLFLRFLVNFILEGIKQSARELEEFEREAVW